MAPKGKADILVIPAFNRSEMLWHALSNLERADGIENLDCRIYVDNHRGNEWDREILDVIDLIPKQNLVHLSTTVRDPSDAWGNSHNLLNAYQEAYDTGAEYIFMVEEDVMVARDFFTWGYGAQSQHRPFATVACTKLPMSKWTGVDGCWFGTMYSSLGVSFHRDNLAKVLAHREEFLPVAETHHFEEYYRMRFPQSKYNEKQWGGQDGFISRVMEQHEGRSCLPNRPRAFHAGYYGYNRSMERRPRGTLAERILEVGNVLQDRDSLVRDYPDCEPCEL